MADKSGSIIFEEGVDVLVTSVDETGGSDTEPASYIVGRGQGEGVTTPPLTVSTQAAPFRNEAYLDARDMKTEAGVQVATDGALAEQAWEDAIAVDVTEDRYEAWTHYGPGDLVRVIAPSRGIDATGIIVAMTVSEEGEVVRTKLDLNAPRTDELLKLKSRANATARSLGVTNRQGQGQLVPFSIADSVYFDTATGSITGVYIPTRMYQTIECRLAIDFDQYPMPVSAAASGGGTTATSASGGGATSGASSASSSNTAGFEYANAVASHTHGGAGMTLTGTWDGSVVVGSSMSSDHSHPIPHTHGTPNHTHDTTVPAHTHALTATASKEAYPSGHSVNLAVYLLVGGAWVQQGSTITGLTADHYDLDLSAYVTGAGQWRIMLQSAAAQPNGGRLGTHLSGYVLGAVRSA